MTKDLKYLAEQSQEEYEEYVSECKANDTEPLDIFSFVAEQIAIEEEYMNQFKRDEGIA